MSESTGNKLYPKIGHEIETGANIPSPTEQIQNQPQLENSSTGSSIGSWLEGGWSLVNTAKEKVFA
jgi:hypothetical protein